MIINHFPRNIAGNHVSAQLEGNWTPFTDFKLERQQEIETYYYVPCLREDSSFKAHPNTQKNKPRK